MERTIVTNATFDCLEDAFLWAQRQKKEYGNQIQVEIFEETYDEPMRWWQVYVWRIYD